MNKPKLIFHADDLGLSLSFNQGIKEAYDYGMLTSTCIRTNGTAFREAVEDIIPACPYLGVGLHLNLVEGRSQRKDFSSSRLCGSDGTYKLGYGKLALSYNDKKLRAEIEEDYRNQIETFLKYTHHIDHLNSHQHSHSIPYIFEIVCKLAQEYKIPYVRYPREKTYICSEHAKHLEMLNVAPMNGIKQLITSYFGIKNKKTLKKYSIKFNDNFVGMLYTGIMDERTVYEGVKKSRGDQVVEVLLHPCVLLGKKEEIFHPYVKEFVLAAQRRDELEACQSQELYQKLLQLGYEFTNYTYLEKNEAYPRTFHFPVDNKAKKLKTHLVLDETPFYQPEYADYLLTKIPEIEVVSGSRVVLPGGGALQSYLLKNWKLLGLKEMVLLALQSYFYRFRGKISQWLGGRYFDSIQSVYQRHNVPFETIDKINTPEFVKYVKDREIDLIISANTLIFKDELLEAPKVGVINRHSSLLPSFGGLFPAFRSIQFDTPYFGATVHKMVKKIDAGEVLSRKYFPREKGESMSKLYRLAFTLSCEATREACQKMLNQESEDLSDCDLKESYYSWPKQQDWSEFRQNGGRFI